MSAHSKEKDDLTAAGGSTITPIMKSILPLVVAVFLVTNLMGMEDGLYDISDPAHPRLIDDLVGQATIRSESNDNTKYELMLQVRDGFPFPTEKMELVISNKTVPLNKTLTIVSEIRPGSERTVIAVSGQVTNREDALFLAGHFHTKAVDRHHPGYQMLVQFIPDKEEFSTNEPVTVKFRITNVGKTEFAYWNDRYPSAAPDKQFAFTAGETFGKARLPVIGGPTILAGYKGVVSLKPGETHELLVDLTKCFNFTAGGHYLIRGSYCMSFCDPELKDIRIIWEDYACAQFEIRIKK